MKKILFAFGALVLSANSWATYNANIKGTLTIVALYTDDDFIYLRTDNMPESHPTCKTNYFVISDDIPLERRQMLLSRLMMAYASKEEVNIGYDKDGNCIHGYMRVHRAG